jgi:hypothetical protein
VGVVEVLAALEERLLLMLLVMEALVLYRLFLEAQFNMLAVVLVVSMTWMRQGGLARLVEVTEELNLGMVQYFRQALMDLKTAVVVEVVPLKVLVLRLVDLALSSSVIRHIKLQLE